MKSIAMLLAMLMTCCLMSAVAAERPVSKLGSVSPAAPVELSYQMPERTPASEPLIINLTIATPIESGRLWVEVTRQENLTLINAASRQFDLANIERPLPLQLKVLPGAEAERFLVVVVSVETALGRLSRSFRITLPETAPSAPVDGEVPHQDGMIIQPAN